MPEEPDSYPRILPRSLFLLPLSDPSNVQSGQVGLSWTESGDDDFASYKVYRSTQAVVSALDTLVTTITQQTTVSYTDTGVQADTTYYYRVFVLDAGGQSTPSNEKSAYTPATSTEAPPCRCSRCATKPRSAGRFPRR